MIISNTRVIQRRIRLNQQRTKQYTTAKTTILLVWTYFQVLLSVRLIFKNIKTYFNFMDKFAKRFRISNTGQPDSRMKPYDSEWPRIGWFGVGFAMWLKVQNDTIITRIEDRLSLFHASLSLIRNQLDRMMVVLQRPLTWIQISMKMHRHCLRSRRRLMRWEKKNNITIIQVV